MLEAMYFTLSSELSIHHATGELPPRNSARSPSNVCPYGRYPCKDGMDRGDLCCRIPLANLLKVIGRLDEKDNHDYRNSMARKKREHLIDAMINAWTVERTRDEATKSCARTAYLSHPFEPLMKSEMIVICMSGGCCTTKITSC